MQIKVKKVTHISWLVVSRSALLLALLSVSFSGLLTQQANASTLAPSQCSDPSISWKALIKTYSTSSSVPDVTDGTFQDLNASQILFQDSTGQYHWMYSPYVAGSTTTGILLKKLSNGNYAVTITEKGSTSNHVYISSPYAQANVGGYAAGSITKTLSDISCIYSAASITYDVTWDASKDFTSAGIQNADTTQSCDALNFQCWMGGIFSGIGDGFNAVTQGLLKGITYIFVPDTTTLATVYGDMFDNMQSQLGFLIFPFDLALGIFSGVLVNDSWDSECASTTCYGYSSESTACYRAFPEGQFFDSNVFLNFCSFETTAPEVMTITRLVLQVGTTAALMFALIRKFREVTTR